MTGIRPKKGTVLHAIVGVFDSHGAYRWCYEYREPDGTMLQPFPGHFYAFGIHLHKRWRWLVKERRLDKSMTEFEPDVEELDIIHRLVEQYTAEKGPLRVDSEHCTMYPLDYKPYT